MTQDPRSGDPGEDPDRPEDAAPTGPVPRDPSEREPVHPAVTGFSYVAPALDAVSRFVAGRLEKAGELKRVSVPVDPTLEISEITQRVVRAGGPALLFERPTRGDMPVLMNLFGTRRRTSLALGVRDVDEILRLCRDTLGEVLRYDRDRHTMILETLRAYLDHGGSTKAAAQALSVHPHTVQYRLGRLEKLSGLRLTDSQERLTIELCLRILDSAALSEAL